LWISLFALYGCLALKADHQAITIENIDANLIVVQKSIIKNSAVAATKNEILKNGTKSNPLNMEATNNKQTTATDIPNQSATPSFKPLPKIPDDLRVEAFQSYAIARFHIATDGSFKVELIKPCNNPKLNFLLLESLKKWQFTPEKHLGIFMPSTKDIRVEFKVE